MPDQASERNPGPAERHDLSKEVLDRLVMEIFERIYDADPQAQKELLDIEAGEDPSLRRGVEELLRSMRDADRGGFFQPSAIDMSEQVSLVGQRFGAYEIRRVIAAGGMGVVYEAWHEHLDRKAAIKMPLEAHKHRKELFRRLQREGRALAKLRHPHVVEVFDAGITEDEVPYLAMAFVDGRTLTAVREAGAYSPRDIIEWMRQIAEALDYLHAAQIYHRDVKPSNIMINRDGHAVLMDFGIAHIGDMTRITTFTPGTFVYMCPEQRDSKATDGSCDLYSLGLVMYELATGAISSAPDLSLLPKRTRDERLIADVVNRCLQREPRARFQSGREMADTLRPKVPDVPVNRVVIVGILVFVLATAAYLFFRPFTGEPVSAPPPAEPGSSGFAQVAPVPPPTIKDLIDQSVDLSSLTSRLAELRERGDLTFGRQADFLNPNHCYVFVFDEEGKSALAILAPGSENRFDLLNGALISDVPALLQGRATVWITLVD